MPLFWTLLFLLLSSIKAEIIQIRKVEMTFSSSNSKAYFFGMGNDRKTKFISLVTNSTHSFINARCFRYNSSYGGYLGIGKNLITELTVPSQIRPGYGNTHINNGSFLVFNETKLLFYPSGPNNFVQILITSP